MVRFVCPLIVVNDISISRRFYEGVLNQTVEYDFGENVAFEGGFAIHLRSHFTDLIGMSPDSIIPKSNNSELYFEEDDLECLVARLGALGSVEYLHELKEQPWGQRVIRFYDPDKHIIEVGESMKSVAKRLLDQGWSIEETALRTSMPEDFVRECV
jgi:catechol 2,3-dioxygenase-like lactoylglutathione lyase family enzyme